MVSSRQSARSVPPRSIVFPDHFLGKTDVASAAYIVVIAPPIDLIPARSAACASGDHPTSSGVLPAPKHPRPALAIETQAVPIDLRNPIAAVRTFAENPGVDERIRFLNRETDPFEFERDSDLGL